QAAPDPEGVQGLPRRGRRGDAPPPHRRHLPPVRPRARHPVLPGPRAGDGGRLPGPEGREEHHRGTGRLGAGGERRDRAEHARRRLRADDRARPLDRLPLARCGEGAALRHREPRVPRDHAGSGGGAGVRGRPVDRAAGDSRRPRFRRKALAPSAEEFEVVVVGGGPAGLSTALLLGRMRRRTLVCDSGRYRNAAARAMHGYLTRDGASPAEFLRTARAEVARYGDVTLWRGEVTGAELVAGGFAVERAGAPGVRARKLVLATGVVDELPAIAGARELYGRGVHHCPYCDGFELRDQPLAVYARDEERGVGLALLLTRWSADVALCTDGPARLGDDQ